MLRAPGGRPTSLHTSPNSKQKADIISGTIHRSPNLLAYVEAYLDFNLTSNPKLKLTAVSLSSSAAVIPFCAVDNPFSTASIPFCADILLINGNRDLGYDVDDDEKQANSEDIATRKLTESEQRAAAMESD
nr:hypothetical protein Iba_chr13aCG4060 [Ipomoea batatas]